MINNNKQSISLNKNSKKKYFTNTIIIINTNLKKRNIIKQAYINNYKYLIGKNIF
jgi:hypothetical protein